ncbi:hyalin-like [Ptychodera flava]|uniref:hyalin-like n=1 Tax=Ptychodera flava TaxID=63121 RepID=UPI00396A4758
MNIVDIEPPVPTCPSDVTQNTDAGLPTASVTWTAAIATDNSGLTPTSSATHTSGDNFAIGSTNVTYTFQDDSSNTAECTFIITVDDVEPPVPTCPSDVTQNTDAGLPTASVTWTAAIATDNSGLTPTSSATHTSGDNFAIGSTNVTYTFQDDSSNTAECTFTITVDDVEPPVPICPSHVIQNTDAGLPTASVMWTAAIATDNSGLTPTSSATHTSGDNFAIGSTNVTYTFQDNSSNSAECTFIITVNDVEPPVPTCPSDVTQNTDAGLPTASVTWTAAIATDNSGLTPTSSATHTSGDNFVIGSTNVTYTFQDDSSNTAECTFIITVDDVEPPVPTCPSDVTQNTDAGLPTASVTWTAAIATDNSGLTPTSSATHTSGDNFVIGSTNVTYTFQDDSSNTAECTFTITVDDVEPPVPICPSHVIQNTDAGLPTASVTWTAAIATDNSGLTPTSSATHTSGDNFAIGSTNVTYTFQDDSSNSAECTFIITVDDVEPPVPTCPNDVTQNTDAGLPTASVTWTAAIATDNSGLTPTSSATHTSGDNFAIGITIVTYTFEDGSSNAEDCTFSVTVNDIEPPVPTCPSDVTQNTDAGLPTASVTWTAATATDNSGLTPTSSATHTSGDNFAIGVTTITYTFQDGSLNAADCAFTVTVNDVEPPIPICPSDVIQNTDAGLPTASVTWTAAIATDNSGLTPTSSATHTSGDNFPIGVTAVTYTFEDGSSNTADCTFTITVNDDESPVPSCPGDITQTTDAGQPTATVTWSVSVTDNSGIPPVSMSSDSPGDNFAIGSTVVNYIFRDGSWNTAACSFTVTVIDVEPPVPTCPSDVTQNTDAGLPTASVMWTAATATDNSGVAPTWTASHTPGDVFPIGSTPVTYIFQDFSFNPEGCSFIVTVVDAEPPAVDCPDDIVVGSDANNVTWATPTATDNTGVDPSLVSSSHSPGSIFDIGTTTVTYAFQDGNDNIGDCVFTVTVVGKLMSVTTVA